ncbi:MAG: glycine cleavage system aminomethyltransferase GcvT [Granulosicoccus sp.]
MSANNDVAQPPNKALSRRTVLYELHKELGGKMVDFAGWQMPVQYPAGIMAEHRQCREQAALFDVSHMGQLELRGAGAAQALEALVPSDIVNLSQGHCRYTFLTNDEGGVLDDLIVTNAGDYLYLVVNASMRDQDIAHLTHHLDSVVLTELTDHALVAVQGPAAVDIVSAYCPEAARLTFMQSIQTSFNSVPCRVSRLGYTGEDGYELSIPNEQAEKISRLLLADDRCEPAGLGSRDSLRLEAGLCLYGNDLDTSTTPVEASLAWAVQKRRRAMGGFSGESVITRQLDEGVTRKLVGIRPEGRVPARHGARICDASGSDIGTVTSGGFAPTLGAPVAMGYVDKAHSQTGTTVMLSVRGKLHPAHISALPFVPHNYKR